MPSSLRRRWRCGDGTETFLRTVANRWQAQTGTYAVRADCTGTAEVYRNAFRKKIYHTIDELQADLDTWMVDYNHRRPNQGRWCAQGKGPGRLPIGEFLPMMTSGPQQRCTVMRPRPSCVGHGAANTLSPPQECRCSLGNARPCDCSSGKAGRELRQFHDHGLPPAI
jgi:hypothetical protein